ncbi:MAG: hypothetical protein ACLUOO_03080 [Coprococcus sp.]
MDTDKIVQREYVLKDDFKGTDLYQQGLIFLNDREVKDRKDVRGLTPTVRDDIYRFKLRREHPALILSWWKLRRESTLLLI